MDCKPCISVFKLVIARREFEDFLIEDRYGIYLEPKGNATLCATMMLKRNIERLVKNQITIDPEFIVTEFRLTRMFNCTHAVDGKILIYNSMIERGKNLKVSVLVKCQTCKNLVTELATTPSQFFTEDTLQLSGKINLI